MTSGSQSPLWRLVAKNAKTIIPLGGKGDGTPLYCVHSISGEVGSFHRMAAKIGTDRRIYGIQAPMDKMNGDFGHSIPALAAYYTDALVALQPEGPLMLGGWSVGATIALEMAQLLKARGREVALILVVDGILYNSGAELTRWNPLYYCKLAANLPHWIADNVMSGWGFSGIYVRIMRELKLNFQALRGQKKNERGSVVDAFMDTSTLPPEQAAFARRLFAATEDYVPRFYDGLVLIFAAKTHPLLHLHQVDVAWRKIARRSDTVYMKGTHLSMMREPQVSELSAHFRSYLGRLEGARGTESSASLSKEPAIGYPSAQT